MHGNQVNPVLRTGMPLQESKQACSCPGSWGSGRMLCHGERTGKEPGPHAAEVQDEGAPIGPHRSSLPLAAARALRIVPLRRQAQAQRHTRLLQRPGQLPHALPCQPAAPACALLHSCHTPASFSAVI